jgi:hypothetical protein
VPADLVLLVGGLGNLDDADLDASIAAASQFCAHGATLIWTRSRVPVDRNDEVRRNWTVAGFTEVDYRAHEAGPAVGVVRFTGAPTPLGTGRLFRFVR